MNTLSVSKLTTMMKNVSKEIIDNEPYLTEIDTIIGDGDHGTGMKRGFATVLKMLNNSEFETVADLFKAIGIELIKSMGGASGVIFGTMFIGGIRGIEGKKEITVKDLATYFEEGCISIQKRGKAKEGQKTMLDAYFPAVRAMNKTAEETEDMKIFFENAYKGSLEGVENTKQFVSQVGRSKNFKDLTVGHPDPGAVSTSLIFKALYESL